MTDTTRKGSGVKDVLHRVSEEFADLSDRARRTLGEAAEKASGVVSDVADEAVSRGRRAARVAARDVREHPIRYVTIGAAIGVLIAAAVMMRRRDE